MKKTIILFVVSMIVSIGTFASNSAYVIDDQKVDALVTNAIDLTMTDLAVMEVPAEFMFNSPNQVNSEKTAVIAFILCWAVGVLGIHRLYLGTSTGTFIGYLLTCGGLGIVSFIDWIVLLLEVVGEQDISRFVDNPKFFMWAK